MMDKASRRSCWSPSLSEGGWRERSNTLEPLHGGGSGEQCVSPGGVEGCAFYPAASSARTLAAKVATSMGLLR